MAANSFILFPRPAISVPYRLYTKQAGPAQNAKPACFLIIFKPVPPGKRFRSAQKTAAF